MKPDDQMVAALRLMVSDVSLPPELRQEAAAKLAVLVPGPADGLSEMLRIIDPAHVEATASFWRPEYDDEG